MYHMLQHLFKLIWNKKKQNFLLIAEMFISFLVTFAVFTLIIYYYNNYKQPTGFDYKNVWVVNFTPPANINSVDSVTLFHETLTNMIKSMPQVEEVSFTSGNVPFSMSSNSSDISYGNHRHVRTNVYQAGITYKKALNFKMLEGRWFTEADNVDGKFIPLVINEKTKEELFGNENAIGKIIGEEQMGDQPARDRYRVIGVSDNLKDKGDYQPVERGMYMKMDTGSMRWTGNMLLKVRPSADAAFESKLFTSLSNAIGTSIEIEHLDKKLVVKNRIMLVPMIIGLIVAGFLIINVALGLFGVLWYNINKRRGEIGLRRAVGATGSSVSKQLVSEALILSTLSLILGLFFAIQFPIMNVFDLPASVYIIAILFAIAFIYVLAIICALYPGKQAASIYPAVALHEE